MSVSHDWQKFGRMDDGAQRFRCVICCSCRHWPGVGAVCGGKLREPGRLRTGQHAGELQSRIVPDAPPNRVCALPGCGVPYHSTHHRSRYCSPRCSRKAWLAANAAAYEARKAKWATRTAEEIEAQRARNAGYTQAYRERQAAE